MKYQVVSQHYYYLLTKGGNKARSCYYYDSHAASSGYFSLTSHLVAFWKCNSLFQHILNINQQHGQVMKVIFCFKELIKLMFNWHKMWHWSVWITSEEDVDRGETSHFFCETDTKTTCETHVWFVHYYTEQIKNCKAVWSGLCLTRGFVLFSLIHMFTGTDVLRLKINLLIPDRTEDGSINRVGGSVGGAGRQRAQRF